ncbi:MAG: tetratricopeptide repeat protein [Candidatus Brocadiia bacterium]
MEALLFLIYGLILLHPSIKFLRDGNSALLSGRIAPLLLVPAILLPNLNWTLLYLLPGHRLDTNFSLNVAAPFLWVSGSIFVVLFGLCALLQIRRGEGVAARDERSRLEGKARLAMTEGRMDDAVACYEAALRLSPDDFASHYRLARALLKAGYFKKAYDELLITVDQTPTEDRKEVLSRAISLLDSFPKTGTLAENFRNDCRRRFPDESAALGG